MTNGHNPAAPESMKVLIYGQWGAGKTRFAASAERVDAMRPAVVWSFDKSTSSIDWPIAIARLTTTDEITQAFKERDAKGYKTVIVDTLTELHALFLATAVKQGAAIARERGRSKDAYVPEQKDYYGAQRAVLQVLRELRDRNVFIIATAQDGGVYDGQEPNRIVVYEHAPRMAKTLSLEIPDHFDLIGYAQRRRGEFEVSFEPRSLTMVKDRTNCIPAGEHGKVLSSPDLAEIYSYFYSTNGKGALSKTSTQRSGAKPARG